MALRDQVGADDLAASAALTVGEHASCSAADLVRVDAGGQVARSRSVLTSSTSNLTLWSELSATACESSSFAAGPSPRFVGVDPVMTMSASLLSHDPVRLYLDDGRVDGGDGVAVQQPDHRVRETDLLALDVADVVALSSRR